MCGSLCVEAELSKRWGQLLETGEWADCSFLVGSPDHVQEEISCHRLVLGACSSVLGAMLLGPMAEKKFPIVLPDETPETFSDFLQFAYTGRVLLRDSDRAVALCHTADKYIVPRLVWACESYLCNDLLPENVLCAYEMAQQLSLPRLTQHCIRVIQEHTTQILQLPSWVLVSRETLMIVLRQKQLNVKGEEELIEAAVCWAQAQTSEQREESQEGTSLTEHSTEETCKPSEMPVSSETALESVAESCEARKVGKLKASSQEMSIEDSDENNLVSKKRKLSRDESENIENITLDENQVIPNNLTSCTEVCDASLLEILGPAKMLLRFLAPSLQFESIVAAHPFLLTPEQVETIKNARSFYQKEMEENAGADCADVAEIPTLPEEICSHSKDRKKPYKSNYQSLSGDSLDFDFGPSNVCDRQVTVNLNSKCFFDSRESSATMYFTPSRKIVLRGIRVPSQVLPRDGDHHLIKDCVLKNYPTTYEENICVEVHEHKEIGENWHGRGKNKSKFFHVNDGSSKNTVFVDTVPYDSMMNIIFDHPFILNINTYKLELTFNVEGKYPFLNNGKKYVDCCKTSFTFTRDNHSRLIQGLIFDTRDTEKRVPIASCMSSPDSRSSERWVRWGEEEGESQDDLESLESL